MSLREWWDAKVGPWIDDIRNMLKYPGDAPSDPDEQPKAPADIPSEPPQDEDGKHLPPHTQNRRFVPPRSLPDSELPPKWPKKEDRK